MRRVGIFLVIAAFGVIALLPAKVFAGTTPIHIDTEQGGDIDTGSGPEQWDGNYENVNGAMFWNGSDWVTNLTAAHSYFIDLRTGQRLKIHVVSSINSDPTQLGEIKNISGYQITKSIYNYSAQRSSPIPDGPNTFYYQALEYKIIQPDSTTIILRSRGSGNGISQPYFDVYIETGTGDTAAMRGDPIWYKYVGMTATQAVNETDEVAGRVGKLATYSVENPGKNNYWMDINGGSDMGGVTYLLIVNTLNAATVPTKNLSAPFVSEFHIEYTDSDGDIQEIVFSPALLSESFDEPPPTPTPTAIATPTIAGPVLIFEDTFSSKTYTKHNWASVAGKWSVSKKGEFLSDIKKDCLATVKNINNVALVKIQTKIKLLSKKNSKQNGGLVFAYQNKKAYRYVTTTPTKITIGQKGVVGGEKAKVKGTAKVKLKKGVWYTLTLVLKSDGSVEFSIPGIISQTATFTAQPLGAAGLVATNSAVSFDEFQAWKLP